MHPQVHSKSGIGGIHIICEVWWSTDSSARTGPGKSNIGLTFSDQWISVMGQGRSELWVLVSQGSAICVLTAPVTWFCKGKILENMCKLNAACSLNCLSVSLNTNCKSGREIPLFLLLVGFLESGNWWESAGGNHNTGLEGPLVWSHRDFLIFSIFHFFLKKFLPAVRGEAKINNELVSEAAECIHNAELES